MAILKVPVQPFCLPKIYRHGNSVAIFIKVKDVQIVLNMVKRFV